MTDRIVSAGDPVKVFDHNVGRFGQGTWDGKVEKVGRVLVHIRWGHNYVTAFRLDTQQANNKDPRQSFRTLAQHAKDERKMAALDVLAAHDLYPRKLPLEVLEQLAAVLTAHDENKDGAPDAS